MGPYNLIALYSTLSSGRCQRLLEMEDGGPEHCSEARALKALKTVS